MAMFQFTELSHEAKTVAAERFVNDIKALFGADADFKQNDAQEFLSKSRVHRYDEKGMFLGRIVREDGIEVFEHAEGTEITNV